MLNQVQRLTSLVDQLLDVSRLAIDRLELTLEDLDLAALVTDVAHGFRAQATEIGCALEVRASTCRPGAVGSRPHRTADRKSLVQRTEIRCR